MPSQLDATMQWGTGLITLVIVAAMMRQMVKAALAPQPATAGTHEFQPQTLPFERERELEEQYGHWAVQTAIEVCPMGDIECVEREAKRLYQARILRR